MDEFGSDDFEGQTTLRIEDYKDQMQHDDWFDLEPGEPGKKWQGKIRLIIQYVHSKTKMLTGYINIWQQQIDDETTEKAELDEVLKQMESPFGFI